MIKVRAVSAFFFAIGVLTASIMAEPSKNFKVFLCFGQSNMSGGAGVPPDDISKKKHDRIKVMAFANCSSPSRTKNQWSDAFEPMHCGDGQNQMGPSYAFGQMLADSLPSDTIGLIPCGLWGVSIEMFMKGKTNTSGNAPSGLGFTNNAWDWMTTKCKVSIERGAFSGIILLQGESNNGDGDAWLTKVKTIYDDLKKEIPLKNDIPIVAGQLLGNSALNSTIEKMPTKFSFGYYASSSGLQGGGSMANLHFNQAGYRTMGQRMAIEMLKGLREVEKVNTAQPSKRVITSASLSAKSNTAKVYSLDGRFIATASAIKSSTTLRPGNIYVVRNEIASTATKLLIAPAMK